jgi:AraC family transcriptional regulator
MKAPKVPIVDFRQESGSHELFVPPPLLTSHGFGWDTIYLEHHQNTHETPEHYKTSHAIAVILNSVSNENWLDGRYHQDWTRKGSVGIYPADVPHRSICRETVEFLVMTIDPAFLDGITREWVDPTFTTLIPRTPAQADLLLLEMGLTLKREVETGCLGGRLYGDAIATMMAVHLLRNYSNFTPQIRHDADRLSAHRLKQATDYIHDRLAEDVSLAAISQHLGMSCYYFARWFKQSMDISPHQYVIQQRVERAKQLLKQPNKSIADVALASGFSSQSQMTQHFRKLMGTTPSAYRRG